MDRLLPLAEKIAARLIERKETVAVAEGSAGGLISAALLAVPGASAYFVGGAVVYTGAARSAFTDISLDDMRGHASGERALCRAARPARARTASHHLGARRGRRRRAVGQSLRGPGRAYLLSPSPGPRSAHSRCGPAAATVATTCALSRCVRWSCSPSRSARNSRISVYWVISSMTLPRAWPVMTCSNAFRASSNAKTSVTAGWTALLFTSAPI